MISGIVTAVLDIAKTTFVWIIRLGFVIAVVFAFVAILNFMISFVFVTMNQTVLNDIMALVQIGLPFNLNVLLAWLLTGSSLYVMYKLSLTALTFMNRVFGNT